MKGQFILEAFPVHSFYSSIDQIPSYVHNHYQTHHNLSITFSNLTLKSFVSEQVGNKEVTIATELDGFGFTKNNGKGCETFIVPTGSLSNLPVKAQYFFDRSSISYKMNVTFIEHGTGKISFSSKNVGDLGFNSMP